jgi:hypothetical protein
MLFWCIYAQNSLRKIKMRKEGQLAKDLPPPAAPAAPAAPFTDIEGMLQFYRKVAEDKVDGTAASHVLVESSAHENADEEAFDAEIGPRPPSPILN